MMRHDVTRDGLPPTLRVLCWLASAALLVAYGCVFARYAVDFPRVDDYSQILAVPYYASLEATTNDALRYIFSLSVEHRLAIVRLAALAQARYLGGLDFIALMIVGAIILACGIALVVAQARREYRAWIALIAVALFVSPVHYEAQYWATGAMQHSAVVGFALAALWCISRRTIAGNVAGFALACAASLTSANGLMTFPAAVVLLWLSRQRRAAIAAAIVTIVAFVVYFTGYQSAGPRFPNLVSLLRFMSAAAGSLAVRADASALLGVMLFAAWLWLAATRARVSPLLIAWGFFLVASSAAMAVGRAELGDDAALLSRYRVYSAAFALVTLVAILPRLRVAMAAIVTALVLAWLVVSVKAMMPLVANTWYAQEITRATYLATGHGVYVPWPPQEYGDFMLDRGKAMGYFVPQPSRYPLTEPAGTFP